MSRKSRRRKKSSQRQESLNLKTRSRTFPEITTDKVRSKKVYKKIETQDLFSNVRSKSYQTFKAGVVREHLKNQKAVQPKPYKDPFKQGVLFPDQIAPIIGRVCENRKKRKKVLFAKRKIGKGGGVRPPRLTIDSFIKC